jgi:hypothetical protein
VQAPKYKTRPLHPLQSKPLRLFPLAPPESCPSAFLFAR